MLHRLFNKGGNWYLPARLTTKNFENFDFRMDWEVMNKMFNLRRFYVEIHPPFSKLAAPRVMEMEHLHDEITAYSLKRSIYHFIAWVLFTGFVLDMDALERPARHWRTDAQFNYDHARIRMTHINDFK
jgi:hypothetical protein